MAAESKTGCFLNFPKKSLLDPMHIVYTLLPIMSI